MPTTAIVAKSITLLSTTWKIVASAALVGLLYEFVRSGMSDSQIPVSTRVDTREGPDVNLRHPGLVRLICDPAAVRRQRRTRVSEFRCENRLQDARTVELELHDICGCHSARDAGSAMLCCAVTTCAMTFL